MSGGGQQTPQNALGGNTIFDTSANQFGAASDVYAGASQPGGIAQSMNAYINPWQRQVMDQSISRVVDNRDQSINRIGADAEAAGAFGGSRHGLLESTVFDAANRNIGELSGNLAMQGFNQAGNFGAQDINNQMNAAGGLAGLANQGFGMGQAIGAQQEQQGAQQQGMLQRIISGGNSQFDSYMGSPQDALNMELAALAGNPLMGENTQSYNPGMFDYVSLAAQTIGSKGGIWGGDKGGEQ
jgi:hypothetical protein